MNFKLLPDKGYGRLEPDVAKVASPVLRRGRASNRSFLFGKTLITHIDEGFDFLGWNFRKYNGKLLIKPSKKSIDSVTRKISDTIKGGKTWPQKNLIGALNPIITGWTNYHQSVVSKDIFSKLDYRVWNMLWRWAKRRHPKKSRSWIVKKYWHSEGTRNWVFSTEKTKLKLFSDTKIVRHTRLKLNMNPYLDKEYFGARRYKLRARKIAGKPKTSGVKLNNCSFCMNSIVSKP